MAGNIKGLTVEIRGETKGLDAALKDVNKSTNALNKELSQIERGLKFDPSNTVLLAQKQEVLGEKIKGARDRLDGLRQAQKDVERMYAAGEIDDGQYRQFQREVQTAESKLKTLEVQARKANAVLSNDQAVRNLKNIGKAAGVAAVAVGSAAIGSAIKAGQAADEINTMAKVTGLSTEQLQVFAYASERIDVDLDTLAGSMAKLTKNMNTARDGVGESAEAFDRLGVSVVDSNGELRSNDEVFDEVIAKLAAMTNETERDAASMAIFGRSAQDLNPLILGGADALKTMGEEAKEAGLILSQDALDSANEFNDAIDELKAVGQGMFSVIGTEIATELIPVMEDATELFKELPEWIEENKATLEVLGVTIGTVTALVIAFNIQQAIMTAETGIWAVVAGTATISTTALGAAFAFLTSPIALVILAIGAVIAIGILLYKNWDTIKEKAGELWSKVTDTFGKIKDSITEKINAARDAVKNAIDKIKEFFKFEWNWPKLKLPHFSLTGSFSLAPPKVPKLAVEWYASGGSFASPAIVGVGDQSHGYEHILRDDQIVSLMQRAMRDTGRGGDTHITVNANIANSMDVRKVAQQLGQELENERRRRGM